MISKWFHSARLEPNERAMWIYQPASQKRPTNIKNGNCFLCLLAALRLIVMDWMPSFMSFVVLARRLLGLDSAGRKENNGFLLSQGPLSQANKIKWNQVEQVTNQENYMEYGIELNH